MEIYTIGFATKSAAEFFETLKRAGIKRVIDVRLNNTSQLAGFTKRDDLRYFLGQMCGADYHHQPLLAPTKELFDGYKKRKEIPWEEFAAGFVALLAERKVDETVDKRLFEVPSVLLCSEPTAEHCHRRLVAEYLAGHWADARVVHL